MKKKIAVKKKVKVGAERRRSVRRAVLDSFHVFIVIPRFGLRKIYLKDVSEGGLGFFAEPSDDFKKGDLIDCFFYINPNLKLPLSFRVCHVFHEGDSHRIGCEFDDKQSRGHNLFVKFFNLLDELGEFLER